MALFEVPKRPGRTKDSTVAKKTKAKPRKTSVTVKGGGGELGSIASMQALVEQRMGKYKDDYIIIQDEKVLHDYLSKAIDNEVLGLDTETTGLDPLLDKLVGIGIYTLNEKPAYIPYQHISYITHSLVEGQLSKDILHKEFLRIQHSDVKIIMFNACFDVRMMRQLDVRLICFWDCYLAARLLNENEGDGNNGLKALHNKYCLDGKGDAFTFEGMFKGFTFDKVPIQTGYLYAAHDPMITYELFKFQVKFLGMSPEEAREDLRDVSWVFHNIEMPCVNVVADMEETGVAFDTKYANKLSEKYHKLLEEQKDKFNKDLKMYDAEILDYRTKHSEAKLDDPINISSPTQLAVLFYDILKVGVIDKKTPRGTGEAILAKIDSPLGKDILDIRGTEKLLSTYIDKLPECVNPNDGRIHCKFNQYGAVTGRFSSSNPNLQNIPSHNKDIRKMFVASPGYVMMSSDYSQQEPKVMTQMCQDPKMIQAYKEGKDLYAEIAALSFNTTYDNCLEFRPDGTTNKEGKERRSQAKSILLGVLYGRGVPSIAEQLGTTTKKAQKIKDSVFKGFPAIPRFEEDSEDMAYDLGYVTTLWGRKRRLPDLCLPEYEFRWKDGAPPDDDLLDFDIEEQEVSNEVPEDTQKKYIRMLNNVWGSKKAEIIRTAKEVDGIIITDNGGKIADAQRQCVNARIQGSAADMTKLAMILVHNDKRLNELGFRLLIPVHDELIGECPKGHAKECRQRFSELMSKAAESRLEIPIKCDVEVTEQWYGKEVEI